MKAKQDRKVTSSKRLRAPKPAPSVDYAAFRYEQRHGPLFASDFARARDAFESLHHVMRALMNTPTWAALFPPKENRSTNPAELFLQNVIFQGQCYCEDRDTPAKLAELIAKGGY